MTYCLKKSANTVFLFDFPIHLKLLRIEFLFTRVSRTRILYQSSYTEIKIQSCIYGLKLAPYISYEINAIPARVSSYFDVERKMVQVVKQLELKQVFR